MRMLTGLLLLAGLFLSVSLTEAQPPDGPKGKGGKGKGGFGGGPMQPGQLLPPFVQEQLKLTDDQKKQLEDIQKDMETKLDKILTDDQKKQLKEMRDNGPGGRGGFGGDGKGKGKGKGDDGGKGGGKGGDRNKDGF